VFVDSDTVTDGTVSLAAGSLTSAVFMDSDTVTDGVASLAAGSLTSAVFVDAVTLTDGTASLAGGVLSNASFGDISDGTATLSGGSLTSAVFVSATTLTDGTGSLTQSTISANSMRFLGNTYRQTSSPVDITTFGIPQVVGTFAFIMCQNGSGCSLTGLYGGSASSTVTQNNLAIVMYIEDGSGGNGFISTTKY